MVEGFRPMTAPGTTALSSSATRSAELLAASPAVLNSHIILNDNTYLSWVSRHPFAALTGPTPTPRWRLPQHRHLATHRRRPIPGELNYGLLGTPAA